MTVPASGRVAALALADTRAMSRPRSLPRLAALGLLPLAACAAVAPALRPGEPAAPALSVATLDPARPAPLPLRSLPAPDPREASEEVPGTGEPVHHLALFLGGGAETRDGKERDTGWALGLDYVRRLEGELGVGLTLEGMGNHTEREFVMFLPVTWFAADGLHLIAAPGIEIGRREDRFALRLGGGYEFELPGGWTVGPDLAVDFMGQGRVTFVGGLSIGRGF